MAPSRVSVAVVVRNLSTQFDLSWDDVPETVKAMAALARRAKMLCAYILSSGASDQEAVEARAYAIMAERIVPAIRPSSGHVCPVCGSKDALTPSTTATVPSTT